MGLSVPKIQRLNLIIAYLDMLLGLGMLAIPRLLLGLFNVPFPAEILWFHLTGLFLIALGAMEVLGFRDTERYYGNVWIAACVRLATGALLLVASAIKELPAILVFFGIGESLVSLITFYYIELLRRRTSALASAPAR